MRTTPAAGVRIGVGSAPAHHGELLQGVVTDRGLTTPALVTLPLAVDGARATFAPGGDRLVVHPSDKVHARQAVEGLLHHLRATDPTVVASGVLRVRSHVAVGIGMGSSSVDVLASLRAVADAVRSQPDSSIFCAHAARVEGACDPLAHVPEVVLFAQREGRIIQRLAASLPPMVVLSCETDLGRPVDTLRCPLPDAHTAPAYDLLRDRLHRAVATADLDEVGAVATTSAELNQERLPKAELPALVRACRQHGGLGVQVAHSGTVAGVLFAGRSVEQVDRLLLCAAALERAGVRVRGWYDVATGA
ncbi:GHMP family kinase ATP-binding protein [Luteipulveratus halotolerans]|uniref:GHMP kinase N-terminal domain-containing protein n=1 Tax=Luteipulveratus halotolerans TaxID=1631356 RepID=A0A0L6CN00_9MICO|nr:hypothetical protein [Luteipulveratus halotolerans]KNX38923.1 hypothetical protein VV01_20185 [Luteipulveratus halotolerans]